MSKQNAPDGQAPQDTETPGAESVLSDEQKRLAALARFNSVLDGALAPSGQDDDSDKSAG